MSTGLYREAGTLAQDSFSLVLTPQEAGWSYSALRVLDLAPAESAEIATGGTEMLVLPLAGACRVDCDGQRFELTGRDSVFSAVTDFAYLPIDAVATIWSSRGGRFALPGATARRRLTVVVDVEIVNQLTGKVLWSKKGISAQGDYAENAEASGRKQAVDRIVNEIIEGAQSQW